MGDILLGKTLVNNTAYSIKVHGPIRFTINSVACEGEKGMTWADWVNSSYNTAGYYVNGNNICNASAQFIALNSTKVVSTDTIQNGKAYTLTSCCFVAGTQVLVSLDGKTKNIEDMEVGDTVISYNIETGENYEAYVHALIRNTYSIAMAKVEFENGSVLEMTDYHPIYTENGWRSLTDERYEKFLLGDIVKCSEGWTKVIKISMYKLPEAITTYTLDVEDYVPSSEGGGSTPTTTASTPTTYWRTTTLQGTPQYVNDSFYANGICSHNGDTVGHDFVC